MKYFIVIFVFLAGHNSLAKQDKVIEVAYVKSTFVQIHQAPMRYSQILTTFECGHPVKVLSKKEKGKVETLFNGKWRYVKASGYYGYINESFLSSKRRGICFNSKFSKFYDSLDLSISDMYFWGRLYDQYNYGSSKAGGDGL